VNLQGPYLYYLLPLVLILPLLGILIVWTTAAKVTDTNFGKGA
jgi:hypothetical protein